jgi:hypothetical protein
MVLFSLCFTVLYASTAKKSYDSLKRAFPNDQLYHKLLESMNNCSSRRSLSDTLDKFVSLSSKIRETCKTDDTLYYKYLGLAAKKCFRNFNEETVIREYDLSRQLPGMDNKVKVDDLQKFVANIYGVYETHKFAVSPLNLDFAGVIEILFNIQLGICRVINQIKSNSADYRNDLVINTVFNFRSAISEGSVDNDLITLLLSQSQEFPRSSLAEFKQSAFKECLVFGLIVSQSSTSKGIPQFAKLTTSKVSPSELTKSLARFKMYVDGLLVDTTNEDIFKYLSDKSMELFYGYSEQTVSKLFNLTEIEDTRMKNEAFTEMLKVLQIFDQLLASQRFKNPKNMKTEDFMNILSGLFEISSGICKAFKSFKIFDQVFKSNTELFKEVFSLQENIPRGIFQHYTDLVLQKPLAGKPDSMQRYLDTAYRICFCLGSIISNESLIKNFQAVGKKLKEESNNEQPTFEHMVHSIRGFLEGMGISAENVLKNRGEREGKDGIDAVTDDMNIVECSVSTEASRESFVAVNDDAKGSVTESLSQNSEVDESDEVERLAEASLANDPVSLAIEAQENEAFATVVVYSDDEATDKGVVGILESKESPITAEVTDASTNDAIETFTEPLFPVEDVSKDSSEHGELTVETPEMTAEYNGQSFNYSFQYDTHNLESIKNSFAALYNILFQVSSMAMIPHNFLNILYSTTQLTLQSSYHAWQSAENTAKYYEENTQVLSIQETQGYRNIAQECAAVHFEMIDMSNQIVFYLNAVGQQASNL